MVKDYKQHIVISVSGTPGAGKTGMSGFIHEALRAVGVNAQLVESVPGDGLAADQTGQHVIKQLAAPGNQVDVVIMDVSDRRSPISEFNMLVATMDSKLTLEHGNVFTKADEKTKNALRRTHLRDKCRQFGIPVSLAALIAPQLSKRSLRDALE